ncbi:MAG: PilX N-terminal domain-containing pilus assembly protein [Candidatus Dormibacteria bacterium]
MSTRTPARVAQRGMVLISSLLLLIIITILALSMFRSLSIQEKIAGNVREKERALHAAVSAQQYAEWWLTQGNNTAIGAIACVNGFLTAGPNSGQICNQSIEDQLGGLVPVTQGPFPWPIRVEYTPPNMLLQSANQASVAGNPNYFATPAFYIADIGLAADAAGEIYQIAAYAYGSAANTIAVVESTYEVQQGVVNRGGL